MKININFEKEGKEVNREISFDLKSFAKKVASSAVNVAKKVETFIEDAEETTDDFTQKAEEHADDVARKAEEHAQDIIEKADNILKKAEECANQVIAKVDDIAKKAEEHAGQVLEKVDKFAKKVKEDIEQATETVDGINTDENSSAPENGEGTAEEVDDDNQEAGDGDNYSQEVDEIEAAKIALENEISQIPEGETFTLAEYLDYTEAYNFDKSVHASYAMAKEFLLAIQFPCTGNTVTAFAKMLTIEKPSYKKLAYAMSGYNNEGVIEYLKENFEIWLEWRPDIKKYCPKANLWQLLIYFKKKAAETENN